MKRILYILPLVVMAACGRGAREEAADGADSSLLSTEIIQSAATEGGADSAVLSRMPVIRFDDTVHNFGTIREGEIVEHKFSFRNVGKTPLLIGSAETTCGCTASDYPRDPVAPGAGGAITVRFKSEGKSGHQEKNVTLSTNAAAPVPQLRIIAEVQPQTP